MRTVLVAPSAPSDPAGEGEPSSPVPVPVLYPLPGGVTLTVDGQSRLRPAETLFTADADNQTLASMLLDALIQVGRVNTLSYRWVGSMRLRSHTGGGGGGGAATPGHPPGQTVISRLAVCPCLPGPFELYIPPRLTSRSLRSQCPVDSRRPLAASLVVLGRVNCTFRPT